jgi:hypothetical protein
MDQKRDDNRTVYSKWFPRKRAAAMSQGFCIEGRGVRAHVDRWALRASVGRLSRGVRFREGEDDYVVIRVHAWLTEIRELLPNEPSDASIN